MNAAGQLALENPRYVVRITGDSPDGKAELDNFIDPESRFPVIATTSELLTTGVDAKTCKLIMIDKTINSLTTFKQIVGRGTRIDEEYGKYYFTIMDFKKATKLFHDPEFDGDNGHEGAKKFYVSGLEVHIVAERVEYIGEYGQLVTESYVDYSRKHIRHEYASLDDFLTTWRSTTKKDAIVKELEEYGIELEKLARDVGKGYGAFDMICHIAYDQPPLTRKERADNVKKRNYFAKYGEQARAVLEALLDKYADEGITTIESPKVFRLRPFDGMGTPMEIINDVFGGKEQYENALQELEEALFFQEQSA